MPGNGCFTDCIFPLGTMLFEEVLISHAPLEMDVQMRDDAAARVDASVYLRERSKQFGSLCGGKHAALLTDENQAVLANVLFARLPFVAAQLMQQPLGESEEALNAQKELLFFNEHYVIKPPQTAVEFRWHQDDEEQLGMCVHRSAIPPYISAWCALDDVTSKNGPLRFISQASLAQLPTDASEGGRMENSGESENRASGKSFESVATAPIVAPAGTVIFFLSNVWHSSSCNKSETVRRAFYAQYSQSKITATPADPWPLSFAIPCQRGHHPHSRKKAKT